MRTFVTHAAFPQSPWPLAFVMAIVALTAIDRCIINDRYEEKWLR
jgi:hypothetical protein